MNWVSISWVITLLLSSHGFAQSQLPRLPQNRLDRVARERAYGIMPPTERNQIALTLFYILENIEDRISEFSKDQQDSIRNAIRDARDALSQPEYVRVLRQDWYPEPIRIFAIVGNGLQSYSPQVNGGTFLVRTDFLQSYWNNPAQVEDLLIQQFTAFQHNSPDFDRRLKGERPFDAPIDRHVSPLVKTDSPRPEVRIDFERWLRDKLSGKHQTELLHFLYLQYRREHPDTPNAGKILRPATDEETLADIDQAREWLIDENPGCIQFPTAAWFRYRGQNYFSIPVSDDLTQGRFFKVPQTAVIQLGRGYYVVPELNDDRVIVDIAGFSGWEGIFSILPNPSRFKLAIDKLKELPGELKATIADRSLDLLLSMPKRLPIKGPLTGHTEISKEEFMSAMHSANSFSYLLSKTVTAGSVPDEWTFDLP